MQATAVHATVASMAHRLLDRAESVKARAEQARQRLEAQRSRNRLVDALLQAAQLERQAGGGLLAGALAFRFFLFLVPFVFVVVMGLGIGADLSGAGARQVARQAGITGLAAQAVEAGRSASTTTKWVTLAIAAVALVIGARNLLKALWLAHALLWHVPVTKLPHPARRSLGLIAVVLAASAGFRGINALRGLGLLGWLLALVLYGTVPAVMWLAVSRLFPHRPEASWLQLWPGAALFGAGVVSLHVVTVVWVARSIEAKSQTYGAIGAALTILLWAYLLGRVVTSAAALNAALAGGE